MSSVIRGWVKCVVLSLVLLVSQANAAELVDCQRMLLTGEYAECIKATQEAIAANRYGENWPVIKAQAELATGDVEAAKKTLAEGLMRYSWSVRLRWLGREAALKSGDDEGAKKLLAEITDFAQKFSWRYTDAEEMVVLGYVDLLNGVDAREVLDKRFEKAKQRNPRSRDAWLAIGGLSLDKHDDALAAEVFAEALKLFPEDADIHFGLCRAFASSDGKQADQHMDATIKANPQHVGIKLLRIGELIDAESYKDADELIESVLKINAQQPEAWAYRAVIAHLKHDLAGEKAHREKALTPWKSNPLPDYLIGKKLSQKYRFQEGAAYQRRALVIDPNFVDAQRQLAQDLLRLGEEGDGWKLAEVAHERDSYNVATFNLLELRDAIKDFATLENESFIVRMSKREAELYGPETLELLSKAKQVLTEKYGLKLKSKIIVEIFPDQNDFAVRTFGMPAVSGYLGVCFGRVITANSPASRRERPSNWQAVLWHEFCHVVTLELTQNRIPRWLSEGISVYEELQANSRWGQHMDPKSREHILDGKLTPLGQLSSAFMRPPSGWHLNFAYFESSMAVEFLVKSYGQAALKNVLSDLAAGVTINDSLSRRCDEIDNLEAAFDTYARQQAEALAPGVDWSKPNLKGLMNEDNEALEAWVKEHPTNFIAVMAYAEQLLHERKAKEAEPVLRQAIKLYPGYLANDNAYEKLAKLYRDQKKFAEERAVLETFASLDLSAVPARLRLIELQREAKDWAALNETGRRLAAIDPLLPQGHEALSLSAEHLNRTDDAIKSLERLLLLDPDDLADLHYRLARVLHAKGKQSEAKRHVLLALEEAPRFRDAQQLLLKLADR